MNMGPLQIPAQSLLFAILAGIDYTSNRPFWSGFRIGLRCALATRFQQSDAAYLFTGYPTVWT
jgi:hypothetical protein